MSDQPAASELAVATAKPPRIKVSAAEADAMMTPGEYVHTFVTPMTNLLMGCDVDRKRLLALAADGFMELAGELAAKMDHGLAVKDGGRWLFVETQQP